MYIYNHVRTFKIMSEHTFMYSPGKTKLSEKNFFLKTEKIIIYNLR